MELTAGLLREAVGCSAADAERFAAPLAEACDAYAINTQERLSAFLAQLGHESRSFRFTTEVWGPTPAQARYEGRADLGNVQIGDGSKFRGHGLIQITGRANHARVRDRLRARLGGSVPDFEESPEMLAEPRWAALSAGDYWDDKGLNAMADRGDFVLITRRINGGLNGHADRVKRLAKATAAMSQSATPPTAQIDPTPPAPKETSMAPAFMLTMLPQLISQIPSLVKLFKPEDEKTQKYTDTAVKVFDIAKTAIGAVNEQEVVETLAADPVAVQTVQKAVQDQWYTLVEAGGGGIDGARKADLAFVAGSPGKLWDVLRSPSFLIACLLLPLVYLIVLSIIGVVGPVQWSDDVRAAIAGTIVGSIVGGLIGYYFGQTTTKNRTPAEAAA